MGMLDSSEKDTENYIIKLNRNNKRKKNKYNLYYSNTLIHTVTRN